MQILFPWGQSQWLLLVCASCPPDWSSWRLGTYVRHVSFMYSSNEKEELEEKLPVLALLRGHMPTQCMDIYWIFKGSLKCQIFTLLISECEHLTSFNWYHVIITMGSIVTSLFSQWAKGFVDTLQSSWGFLQRITTNSVRTESRS